MKRIIVNNNYYWYDSNEAYDFFLPLNRADAQRIAKTFDLNNIPTADEYITADEYAALAEAGK